MSASHHPVLKVAVVIGQLSIGGSERQLYQHIVHEGKRIRFLVVCASDRAHPYADRLRRLGVPVRVLGDAGVARRAFQLARLLQSTQSDLLHSIGDPGALYAVAANLITRLPHLHSLRGSPRRRGLARRLALLAVRWRANLIAVNTRSAASFFPAGNVVYTPNGVDSDDVNFHGLDSDVERAPRAPGSDLHVLYLGRAAPDKDLPTLRRAIRRADALPCDGRRLRFALVGRGLEAALPDLPGQLGRGAIRFPGEVEDPGSWLRWADVLVLSSRSEGMPNAVLEAMAHGCAVVSTAVQGCVELIRDGQNGLLVPIGDANALADALRRVQRDETLREQLGSRARATAARYSSSRATAALEDAYLRTLATRRADLPAPSSGT